MVILKKSARTRDWVASSGRGVGQFIRMNNLFILNYGNSLTIWSQLVYLIQCLLSFLFFIFMSLVVDSNYKCLPLATVLLFDHIST